MTAKLGANSEIVLESKYAFGNRRAADLASDRQACEQLKLISRLNPLF